MGKYRRIAKIQFENRTYQYYRNVDNRKMAFLKYDEVLDTYKYPTVEEVFNLAYCFKNDGSFSFYRKKRRRNSRHKLYKFVPKCVLGGAALTTAFILGTHARDLNIDLDYFRHVLDFDQEELVDIPEENYNESEVEESLKDTSTSTDEVALEENIINQYQSYIIEHSSDFFDIDEDINDRVVDAGDYIYNESSNMVMINNTEAFREFNIRTDYTYQDMADVIDKSIRIDEEFKPSVRDFCKTMYEFYDDIDWTVFYNNLKMLKIERDSEGVLDQREAYATYNAKENKIYVSQDLVLDEDTLDIVIFRHELGHLFTEANFTSANNIFMCRYAKFQDEGEYIKEGLNTIFTTEPFLNRYSEETENNMGYAIVTNYLRILIEIMPNFKIQQMTWGNYEYFADKLDEAFECNVDARTLISLIELQCNEYYNKGITGSEDDYREIYEYLGLAYDNYFKQNNISNDEIQYFIDTIEPRLLQGVDDISLIYYDEIANELYSNNGVVSHYSR